MVQCVAKCERDSDVGVEWFSGRSRGLIVGGGSIGIKNVVWFK